MKKTMKAVTALCAFALASSAFATIQPTRVGPVSQYGALADDGLAAARQDPAALYRLTRTGDGWSLQKIALAF